MEVGCRRRCDLVTVSGYLDVKAEEDATQDPAEIIHAHDDDAQDPAAILHAQVAEFEGDE